MTVDGKRFDQPLYDAVMASPAHGRAGIDSSDYQIGYENGALVAARIAAERAPVAQIPEWVDRIDVRRHPEEPGFLVTCYRRGSAYYDAIGSGISIDAAVADALDPIEQVQDAPPSH